MDRNVCESAERVFEILELFDCVRQPMRAETVSDRLQHPTPSTVQILDTMVQKGFLAFDHDDDVFYPTSRVSELGDWLMHAAVPDPRLVELARELHEEIGAAVSLNVRHDFDSQCIFAIAGTAGPATTAIQVGSRRPLVASAAGVALLAQLPVAEAARILDHGAAAGPGHEPSPQALRERLARARRLGYACAPGRDATRLDFGTCVRNRLSGVRVAIGIQHDDSMPPRLEHELHEHVGRKLRLYLALA